MLRLAVFCALAFVFSTHGAGLSTNIISQVNDRLALWLKADIGVASDEKGFVSQWTDQSGHGHHAQQTNAISQPLLVKNGDQTPVLSFDGATNFLEIPNAPGLEATGDLSIFAVVKLKNIDVTNSLFSKTIKNLPAPIDLYLNPAGQPRLFTGDGSHYSYLFGKSNVVAGQFAIVSAVIRGTNGMLFLNGAFNGSKPIVVSGKDSGGPLLIGTRNDFAQWLNGDLAEILFLRGTVSDAERISIHEYLGNKYRVPLVYQLSVSERPVVCRFEGQTASFSVLSEDPTVQYQWQRDEVDIPDATNAVYTTPLLNFSDSNSRYRALVSAPGTNRYVESVTLIVLPDTEPLTSTTAAFLLRDQSHPAGGGIPPPFSSRFWPLSDEPMRNVVQSIAQTADGLLWAATAGGLCYFDGERFEFVPIGANNSLTNKQVNALSTDPDGSLWVGTAGAGLFQLKQNHWIDHPTPAQSDPNVLSLCRAFDGSLWIGTRKGVAIFKNEKLSLWDAKNNFTQAIRSIVQDTNGNVWVSAAVNLIQLKDESVVTNLNMEALNPTFIRSVCCSRDGSVWIGANSGLIRLKDGEYEHFSKTNGLPDNVVTVVYEDRRGNLWVGTSGGLCRLVDEQFLVETTAEGEAYDQILSIFEDREDNLWVGAKNGLYQLRIQQFTTYTTRHGLAHNNVTSIYEDQEGAMWIGTWGGGLHCLRGGKITIYSAAKNQLMRNDLILAIYGTSDGSLWFGEDYDSGLYRLKESQMTRFGQDQGFGPTAIRTFLEDSKGRLVIGTAQDSVKILEQERVTDYLKENRLPTRSIRCLLQGKDGRMWIGTEAGLSVGTNDSFTALTTKDGLSDNTILAVYEDAAGTLWIGTARGGLNRLRDGKFTSYTTRQGLFDDGVQEILQDDAGNFWFASRRGVFRVNRKDFDDFDAGKNSRIICEAFGKADGMNSPVCVSVAKPSAWKSKDGRLWFATTKGLAVTDPKLNIAKNEKSPPVVIEEVISDKSRVLGQNLVLKPGRGELEFHYTALSYTAPEKNRFKYKLEGLDADWVDAETRHTAFYNNVPPGHYTFQVIACNNDGVWNSTGKNIKISILPHYWQTWWFKSFIVLAGLSLAATGARYATKKRMQFWLERLEQQHAIEKERTRLAQDMHDDLGAGLTGVLLLTEKARASANQDAAAKANHEIALSVRELAENLDALVWAENPRHDTLARLVSYVSEYAVKFLGKCSIRCRLDVPDALPDYPASSEMRHNVYLIVKESLNNVAKYANATEVWIRFRDDNSSFVFLIEDNGKGFSQNETRAFGNGLINMRKRAEAIGGSLEISSEPGNGTKVKLGIPWKPVT